MIKSLHIENIAVIENVNIDFEGGFNILTGETGAGKSIIIDSINLLKGERASKDIIRNGEAKARVDAVFDVDSKTAEELSEILGVDISDEIMRTRELSVEGKTSILLYIDFNSFPRLLQGAICKFTKYFYAS